MTEMLRINRLGHRGDGVALAAGGAVHVPLALPGELVEADLSGERPRLVRVVEAAPERVAPYCPEVGACGGCATQQFAQASALAWKRQLLAEAFGRAGLEVEDRIAPCLDAHGAGRRRVTFHARPGADGRIAVGFAEARSHAIVPIAACPLLAPELAGALPAARALAAALSSRRKPLDIVASATLAGLDVDVRGGGPPPESLRLRLVELAGRLDLARLSIHGDVVVERRRPTLAIGRAEVTPPPGAFLQATALGEAELARLVAEGVAGAKRVADLFCGVGPFALRLAGASEVYAADTEKPAVEALAAAARMASGLKRVTAEARDLFRRPLTAAELAKFDAVVFDPPRAGAEAQARTLAASKVRSVVAVSCSAATLARDAAILIAGGYRLDSVTPVDQFRHSAHVEAVARFSRS
ncbi:class I SAM-dependent RNA methyltransferase [Hansschlegelia beijingensis]|uniref:23S rRNA (Uracil1939-C5)-methyltransferase n=1 Tax=Hansschlegelia beijingensis TaxID=1133344 RepID=A0A7W6CV20_9HYPH|nr:class I SAM-dependent RNA methyltransferase [Hansschlegelia beijingensis]MBB3971635.1 23S rRNA (uracil1939-C5)-methyltransferase [Hansschlegelia beijingensis]